MLSTYTFSQFLTPFFLFFVRNPGQDAIVYASVIEHLNKSGEQRRCFINRNSKDFDNPDIEEALDRYSCRILFNFDAGFGYIKNQIGIV